MSDNSNISAIATIGAATAGTFLGISALFLAQKREKNLEREAKLERLRARKQKYLEKK